MIRSLLLLFAFIVLFCEPLGAQNLVGTALRLKPSSLPLTCNIGDLRTDQLDSYKLKQCGVGNLWAEISGGGDALTLQGRDINAAAPAPDDVLTWNDSTSEWEPRAAQAPLPNFTSGRVLLGDGTNIPVTDSGLTFNTGTDALTATTFIGNLTGNVTGNLTGDVTGNLTGNVTGNVSGSSGSTTGNAATATALAANPAACAANRFVNDTAANGDLTCAQPAFTDISGVATIAQGGTNKALSLSAGGVPYFDADSFEVLSAGTSGFVLTSQGTSAPAWAAPPTGSGINMLGASNPKAESGSELPWTETGGGTLTVTNTAADVMNGTYAFSYDASANTDHADSPAITIQGLKGQSCLLEFWYKGFDTNITFQVHDGTNIIASQAVAAAATNYTKQQMNFVCPSSGTLQMRILAGGNAAIGYWDEVHLGSATNVVSGPIVTEWTSWTPTGSWSSNTTYTGMKRRVGDYAEYKVKVATGGAPTSATLTVNLPSGEVIDTAKLVSTTAYTGSLGTSIALDAATSAYNGNVTYSSTTAVKPNASNASATNLTVADITQASPFTFGASDAVDMEFSVPIVGWSNANTAIQLTNQNWRVDANITGTNPALSTSAQTSYTAIEGSALTLTNNTGDNILTAQIPCSSTNAPSGTTCAAGSESVGVSFTIPRSGAAIACVSFSELSNITASTAYDYYFQIVETPTNAQTISQEGKSRVGHRRSTYATGGMTFTSPNRVCGTFNFTSAGQKVLRLFYEQSILSGTVTSNVIYTDADANNGQRDIHWEVYPIDQQIPAPVLTGSVTSNCTDGAERIERAKLNCDGSSTIQGQSGTWISSIGNIGTGACAVTFTAGAFSAAPTCTFTINQCTGAGGTACFGWFSVVATTSGVTLRGLSDTGADATSFDAQLICMGPR